MSGCKLEQGVWNPGSLWNPNSKENSLLAEYSKMNLQVIGQENSLELRTGNDELMNLRTAREYSKTTSSHVRRECTNNWKKNHVEKFHEANQARLESDHRLRNAESEIVRGTDMNRNAENEAIARLRMKSHHELQQ